jgi:uncharacterized protein YndB with AHSA1/START domain
MPAKPSLTLQRRLNAAPAKVFRAWAEPAQILKWMHPSGNEMIHAEVDARVEGRFQLVMRGADGAEHAVSGRYLEVVPDAKLVFTWTWKSTPERESRVTVALRPDGPEGDRTLLTLTHEQFVDEETRDAHATGWTSVLDGLERYLT